MQDFMYDIPTKVIFGKGTITKLPAAIKGYGDKVLLLYGGGSIKRNGIYDKIITMFSENNISFIELSGVEPNPRISTVKKGIDLCKAHDIQLIVAVGGGSTCDCAKAISAGLFYGGDTWDLCKDRTLITNGIPIIAIPTIAATGSEMDCVGVITNEETQDKKGLGHPVLFPKVAICDPTYTFTVSPFQTASGTADIISHTLETYFRTVDGAFIQERMCEAVLKTCFHYGPIAIAEPDNYDARANLMWASEWAMNGMLKCGFAGPWVVHPIEHQLSAYYDVAHGAGLAVLTPSWFRKIYENEASHIQFRNYAVNVFGFSSDLSDEELAKKSIEATEEFFFDKLKLPRNLRELGISDKNNFEVMAEKSVRDGVSNAFVPLSKEDVIEILEMCY